MDETRIKLLIDSYGLVYLLENAGYTEEGILEHLINDGWLDLNDYFEDMEEEEGGET